MIEPHSALRNEYVCVVGSIEGALAARSWLHSQHRHYAQADKKASQFLAKVFAPASFACLFEMEPFEVQFGGFSPEWPLPPSPGFLVRRKWLTYLKSILESSQSIQSGHPSQAVWVDPHLAMQLHHLLGDKLPLAYLQSKTPDAPDLKPLLEQQPILQAGATALAAATHHYRQAPANAFHAVVCLAATEIGVMLQQAEQLKIEVDALNDQIQPLKLTLTCQQLILGSVPRLALRQLSDHGYAFTQTSLPNLLGALAYANRVITNDCDCRLLATALGRDVNAI